MLTELLILVWLVAVIALTTSLHSKVDVLGLGQEQIIEEDKVYEAEWDHCPEGSSAPVKMKVSDESWSAFQARYNNMIAAYPANCNG